MLPPREQSPGIRARAPRGVKRGLHFSALWRACERAGGGGRPQPTARASPSCPAPHLHSTPTPSSPVASTTRKSSMKMDSSASSSISCSSRLADMAAAGHPTRTAHRRRGGGGACGRLLGARARREVCALRRARTLLRLLLFRRAPGGWRGGRAPACRLIKVAHRLPRLYVGTEPNLKPTKFMVGAHWDGSKSHWRVDGIDSIKCCNHCCNLAL